VKRIRDSFVESDERVEEEEDEEDDVDDILIVILAEGMVVCLLSAEILLVIPNDTLVGSCKSLSD
jgi:hypothetical protein